MKRVEKRQGFEILVEEPLPMKSLWACRGRAAFALSCCPRLEEGFAVAEATNAEIALRVLENRRDVNLVFTDIQLPGDLDGLGLAPHVHERWPGIVASGERGALLKYLTTGASLHNLTPPRT
jgi:CheY-like chemotaxis protein